LFLRVEARGHAEAEGGEKQGEAVNLSGHSDSGGGDRFQNTILCGL
jgi:hypothetical protein